MSALATPLTSAMWGGEIRVYVNDGAVTGEFGVTVIVHHGFSSNDYAAMNYVSGPAPVTGNQWPAVATNPGPPPVALELAAVPQTSAEREPQSRGPVSVWLASRQSGARERKPWGKRRMAKAKRTKEGVR